MSPRLWIAARPKANPFGGGPISQAGGRHRWLCLHPNGGCPPPLDLHRCHVRDAGPPRRRWRRRRPERLNDIEEAIGRRRRAGSAHHRSRAHEAHVNALLIVAGLLQLLSDRGECCSAGSSRCERQRGPRRRGRRTRALSSSVVRPDDLQAVVFLRSQNGGPGCEEHPSSLARLLYDYLESRRVARQA